MEQLTTLQNILKFDAANPLLFNTGLFLILFLIFLLIYQLISRWQWVKMLFVIAFSLYFYYKSSAEYSFILLGVCVFDFILGNALGNAKSILAKKSMVAVNVIVNIGMLVYFKYFNLIFQTFANITNSSFDPFDIILPAGISFFTFRSISYIVDIYRGDIEPCKNFLHYTFFLTFFPPLLAGPVVRAKDMLPQIRENRGADRLIVGAGFFLIITGLVKKVMVADYISGNFVDRIFDNPSLYTGFENLIGVYGFTLQLYCDFSGYSDMAIGIALLLGFRFKDNFNAPFKSQSPTEFWRRWHISLSTWLRDYLYIPMGGSRTSQLKSHRNLVTTMVLGGLWHGASWMYVIWGAWNGVLLVLHKVYKKIFGISSDDKPSAIRRFINIFITFNLMALGFMFFRSESMEKVGEMTHQILFNFHAADVWRQFLDGYLLIVLAIIFGFVIHFAPHSWTEKLREKFSAFPLVIQAIILSGILFLIIQIRSSDLVPFIYLQY